MLYRSDDIYKKIEKDANQLYSAFEVISILSIANLSFFIQHIMTFIVTRRLGRFYGLQGLHFTDTILAGCSMVIVHWFVTKIQKDLWAPELTEDEYRMRLLANFEENIDFKFQYLFSVSVACLMFRIMTML